MLSTAEQVAKRFNPAKGFDETAFTNLHGFDNAALCSNVHAKKMHFIDKSAPFQGLFRNAEAGTVAWTDLRVTRTCAA
jgi:hypothetical protein